MAVKLAVINTVTVGFAGVMMMLVKVTAGLDDPFVLLVVGLPPLHEKKKAVKTTVAKKILKDFSKFILFSLN